MLKDKTKKLKKLLNNLTNIDYKEVTTKNIIDTHQYNLKIQKETYDELIYFINNLLNEIKNIENINEYYDDLMTLSITKHKTPILEELNISNYISLRSISLNKKITNELNKFYKKINEIIDNIQKEKQKIEELKIRINDLNNKIDSLKTEKINNLKYINRVKEKLKIKIDETEEELNKTFFINIFKKDSLRSKIDLLKEEYNKYEEQEINLENDYKNKIEKEELKLTELKNTLN